MKSNILKIFLALLPVFLVAGATLYLSGLFGTSIPDFAGERLDGRTFTKNNIRPDTPVFILYVDVTCEDCMHLIDDIVNHASEFEQSQVIIISPQGKPALLGLQNTKQLQKHRFITLLDDRFKNFEVIIKAKKFPTVLVYNKNHRLVRRFDEKPTAEEMLKSIQ